MGSAILSSFLPWIGLTVGALILVLVGEVRGIRALKLSMKPLASLGYLGAAFAAGALRNSYSKTVLAALVLYWVGDAVLLGKDRRATLAGMGLFLVGHFTLILAFLDHGFTDRVTIGVWMGLVPVVGAVMGWLWSHLSEGMRRPVLAYLTVGSTMVATCAGAVYAGLGPQILAGVLLIYVSDLFVARNRFVAPGAINRLIGLPMYYAGALLVATSLNR